MLLINHARKQSDEATGPARSRASRWVTWLLWLMVGLSLGFWVHQWREQTERHRQVNMSASVPVQPAPAPSPRDVGLWLGAAPAPTGVTPAAADEQADVRRKVVVSGVASGPGGEGLALLAVAGQPVRPFSSGAAVMPGWVLGRVTPRAVELRTSDGGATVVLPLPERARP